LLPRFGEHEFSLGWAIGAVGEQGAEMANDEKARLTDERIKELLGNDGKNLYLAGKEEITSLLREVLRLRESSSHTVSADKPLPEVKGRRFRR
jgi:hypothetical protein